MKILGIGVDIIENSRIKLSMKNSLFIKRIFTSSEIRTAFLNYFNKSIFW